MIESDDSDMLAFDTFSVVFAMECLVLILRALAEGRILDMVRMNKKVTKRTRGDAHGVRLLLIWNL